MGYRATKPTVYIVHWPQISTVKVGFSCNQRWRSFVLRGARIVDLVEFDSSALAFEFETLLLRVFSRLGRYAFTSASEADQYLGGRGGGWLECYKIPCELDPLAVLRETDWETV